MTFLFDLDGTLCTDTKGDYTKARPIRRRIQRVNELHTAGEKIIIWTARGTFTGVSWRELTERQLKRWGVKYNELIFGKPPCDLHICDKAIDTATWDRQDDRTLRRGRWGSAVIWSAAETLKLKLLYPHIFEEEVSTVFPGRSPEAVKSKALLLDARKSSRRVLNPRQYESDLLGGYVSGLVDGEGWFSVSLKRKDGKITHYNPKFGMSLRKDDIAVLEFLRGYFSCGRINIAPRPTPRAAPSAIFCITGLYNMLWSVVPHFLQYPLRAKKIRDFITWHEMVKLSAEHFGESRWPDEAQERMNALYRKLLDGRVYREPSV